MYVVGDTIQSFLHLQDAGGDAITGATFAIVSQRAPTGGAFSGLALSEDGAGDYHYTFVPTSPGQYYLRCRSNTTPAQDFEDAWDVDAVGSSGATVASPSGTTRLALRQRVGRRLGDLLLPTATSGPNSDVVFVDTVRLTGPVAAYKGRELTLVGGTTANLGQTRAVTDSSAANRSLSLASALPAAVQPGDQAELWNTRGTGWTYAEANAALDAALAAAGPFARPPVLLDAGAFAAASPTLTLDPSLTHLAAVEWQDDGGTWRKLPRATRRDGNGWFPYPDRSGRVGVGGGWRYRLDGRAVRVAGYGQAAPLASDADTTDVNAEWVVEEAVADLLQAGIDRAGDPDQASRERLFLVQRQRADKLRGLATQLPAIGVERIR